MLSHGSRDVYFTQKRSELMGSRYAILDWIADLVRFPKRALDRAGFLPNKMRISLHAFMAWTQSKFLKEETLKLEANRTHWDLAFNSSSPGRDRREREGGVARYT